MDDFPSVTGRIHPNDRALAVHKFIWSGNLRTVGELFGVSPQAIHKAKKKAWWHELEEIELAVIREEHAAKLRRTVSKALSVVEDRLEHGDQVLGAEGQLRFKPVDAKSAAVCFGIISQHMTKAQPNQTVNINMDLASLAAQFTALAQGSNRSQPLDGSLPALPGRGKADPV